MQVEFEGMIDFLLGTIYILIIDLIPFDLIYKSAPVFHTFDHSDVLLDLFVKLLLKHFFVYSRFGNFLFLNFQSLEQVVVHSLVHREFFGEYTDASVHLARKVMQSSILIEKLPLMTLTVVQFADFGFEFPVQQIILYFCFLYFLLDFNETLCVRLHVFPQFFGPNGF